MSRPPVREGEGGSGECRQARALEVPPCCGVRDLFCEEAWAGITGKLGLSARQAIVVRYVVADRSDHDIAEALSLSRSTVQTHMERLHNKLNVHSRVQLVTRVVAAYLSWRNESPPPTGCRVHTRLASL